MFLPYTGNPLDRASENRRDPEWLAAMRREPATRILPMWRQQPFLLGKEGAGPTALGFVAPEILGSLGGEQATEIFLGLKDGAAFFARDISAENEPLKTALRNFGHFQEARAAASLLPDEEPAIMAQAKALLDWHARHGFCANCGNPTRLEEAGYRRACANCAAEHFPRTDPAVIMLATKGERCLLAHNKRFAANRYSTLAGFIEPGETIEEAVRREIFEEAGLRIGAVTYFASQPWPYPASLMIGCFAESLTDEILIDGREIGDAQWFTRDHVRALLDHPGGDILLPQRQAIAHHLIRTWMEA